ncbi:MAG: hypothetical protein JWL81_1491, partial [Verrucomicrobiales bacterium]|nr:hypothetical protein [Verrucomicrobiales bacterium]
VPGGIGAAGIWLLGPLAWREWQLGVFLTLTQWLTVLSGMLLLVGGLMCFAVVRHNVRVFTREMRRQLGGKR